MSQHRAPNLPQDVFDKVTSALSVLDSSAVVMKELFKAAV